MFAWELVLCSLCLASGRPELDEAPSARLSELFCFLLTHFPKLGVASNLRAHVCRFIVRSPGKQCGAMDKSLLCTCRCTDRFFSTFAHAAKLRVHKRKRHWEIVLTKCGWYGSECWTKVSDVHLSLVNEPLVSMSANCCVVLTYLI